MASIATPPPRTVTRVLASERSTLEALLPGLDAELATRSLGELEASDGAAINLFREAGGAALLIPTSSDGLGATPVQAVDVQCAIGSRAPSLAIASTMHHFSVGTLVEMTARTEGLETLLLQAVARDRLLIASGFAEGRTGQGILAPTMRARRANGGWVISGAKKPCSLSDSMDLLTASVALETEEGGSVGVALVPARSKGVERRRFWANPVLRGTESHEVILDEVTVPAQLVFRLAPAGAGQMDRLTADGFLWFELLMAASYLGIAHGLLERAASEHKGTAEARLDALVDLQTAKAALDAVALAMTGGERGDNVLARAVVVRYGAQQAIARATALLVECLGGMAYIGSPDVGYLYTASRALAFHPPSRLRMAEAIGTYLDGGDLAIG